MMRGVLAAVVLVLAVPGCGGAADDTASPTDTFAESEPIEATSGPGDFTVAETDYIEAIGQMDESLASVPVLRRSAVEAGRGVCDALDRGTTFDQLAKALRERLDDDERGIAAAVIVTAPQHLCPEWGDEMEAWTDSL